MSNSTITTAPTTPRTPVDPHPTLQACAACKHQRRKCVPGCLLAPYFPSSAFSTFLNAHKLFGVKKITRTLQSLHDPVQRGIAARSIIAHANARAADPSGGCLRIVCDLTRQIEESSAELALVQGQLGVFRAQQQVFLGNDNVNTGGVDKDSLFDSTNKFGLKEDVELKREIAQDEETYSEVAASLNLSSLSDFIHKVEVER